jgi:hypothetical protein
MGQKDGRRPPGTARTVGPAPHPLTRAVELNQTHSFGHLSALRRCRLPGRLIGSPFVHRPHDISRPSARGEVCKCLDARRCLWSHQRRASGRRRASIHRRVSIHRRAPIHRRAFNRRRASTFHSAKQSGTRDRFRCSKNSEIRASAICHIPRKHRFSIFSV